MKPKLKRVLLSKKKTESKGEWENKTFEDDLNSITFTLLDCGKECTEEIKETIGKQVILADSRGIKVKDTEFEEWFIMPQEVIIGEI